MNEFPPNDKSIDLSKEWESLIGEAPCGYLLTDPKGNIQIVNNTLLEWLRYTKKEVGKKMRFQDLLPPGEKIFYESRHSVMLKLQNQVNELNYSLIDKEKNRLPVLVNSARHLNDRGEVVALQFVIFLFSDRKKYEQELLNAKKRSEEAATAKTNFLSIISHEIRTPIHAILNASEILIQDQFSEEQNDLLEVIHHSGNNLLDLINAVLNITKIEAGSMKAIKEPFRIKDLLNQLLTIYQPLALKKNILFELFVPEDIPNIVAGDKINIRQILTNLIGNAIKFTQKGKVALGVKLLAINDDICTLRFTIKDTGIGISKNEIRNIFKPFTQANQAIYQQYGGTGLGLSISQRILRLLQSEMNVESEQGKGTTFSFDLKMPISEESVEQKVSLKIPVQPEQFAHLNVLLIDDVYSNILIIKRYFKMWNVSCDHVLSGKAAIEKIQNQKFNLILMDISMPEMDGYETSKAIRSLQGEKFKQIPIIALSAFDLNEIGFKVKRAGMNDILPKPFKANQLYETIIKWTPSKKLLADSHFATKEIVNNEAASDIFSLKNICELFDGDSIEIRVFLKNVIKELKVTIKEFTVAKEQYSLDIYQSAAHKNASKLGMYDLHLLKKQIFEGEKLLVNGEEKLFTEKCSEIIFAFRQFEEWMQKKVDEKEVLCDN